MENNFDGIYNSILQKLLSVRWLLKWNIEKGDLSKFLNSKKFKDELKENISKADYSCKGLIKLMYPFINKLYAHMTEEEWLSYIYEYTLSKSFSNAPSIVILDNLSSPCELYLRVLHILCSWEKESQSEAFKVKYSLKFLGEEEINSLECSDEYDRFIKAFNYEYVYELMKISEEVKGYSTLDHICGVHYLALYIARQLKKLGIDIDLGRVSGAACGHDIGKYGCKISELKRVPSLHYYYTDEWFKNHNITYIGNIAINHSTWDLELENLPIESLILIYCDFRVKENPTLSNKPMCIFNLKDSFEIILNKLENVDGIKINRYKRVYAKLNDFEEFLISLNVDVFSYFNEKTILSYNKESAFLFDENIIDKFKYRSIHHNIKLMFFLRTENSLESIIECARGEKEWKNLRTYLNIFEEYSTYLTQNQKIQTIEFLKENLVHPEDDIRKKSAEIIALLLCNFDEEYRKELPLGIYKNTNVKESYDFIREEILYFLYPGYKSLKHHKFNIGYSLKFFIKYLFVYAKNHIQKKELSNLIISTLLQEYEKYDENEIFILESLREIPLDLYENIEDVFKIIFTFIKKRSVPIRISALRLIIYLYPNINENHKTMLNSIIKDFKPKHLAEQYLFSKLNYLNDGTYINDFFSKENINVSDLFLSNLKTDTHYIVKEIQIEILFNYVNAYDNSSVLQCTIHFCNLLKVSAQESVRNLAGNCILSLIKKLSYSERNEVAIELTRALEIDGNRFTEYIPIYLGKIILALPLRELDELTEDMRIKMKTSSITLKSLIIKTIGIAISNYFKDTYKTIDENREILLKFIGILLNGLSQVDDNVRQASSITLGKYVFGSKNLSLIDKATIFELCGKKILNLTEMEEKNTLLFLSSSVAFKNIYGFINEYTIGVGKLNVKCSNNIAFFPGTFDPFSLSHMEICSTIIKMGLDVYLAIDEFSWSKRTLPANIRRNILNMSCSENINIYVFPTSIPVNISNDKDLEKLRELFLNKKIYIAVGSDVILNASAYKELSKIHNFNHIIVERFKDSLLDEKIKKIEGDVVYLTLPQKFTDISSSKIRENIDNNKDVSSLLDPLSQNYIYNNGFYQKEPLNKSIVPMSTLNVECVEDFNEKQLKYVASFFAQEKELIKYFNDHCRNKETFKLFYLKDKSNSKVLGSIGIDFLNSTSLFSYFKDFKICSYLRDKTKGNICVISMFMLNNHDVLKNLEYILLTEAIYKCITENYSYLLFYSKEFIFNSTLEDTIKNYGFIKLFEESSKIPIYGVDITAPSIINLDCENVLKEPFRSNPKIKKVIAECRKKLLKSISALYPGKVLLSIDSQYLNTKIIEKICCENSVICTNEKEKKLGSLLCVPYGDIMERYRIPNTITKALHTEKYFLTNMKKFFIKASHYYSTLDTQIKTIKSFNKEVILVDNLIHKGYRIHALNPMLNDENVIIRKTIVGILSGRGKDLMENENLLVEGVYFIPKLKLWFNENSIYPFIGGDSVEVDNFIGKNLIPSINLILPYTSPTFIKKTDKKNVYNFSKTCIENSICILEELEKEYHSIYNKKLTISSMGKIFTIPRTINYSNNLTYDFSISPTVYLKNDLEFLNRLEDIILD